MTLHAWKLINNNNINSWQHNTGHVEQICNGNIYKIFNVKYEIQHLKVIIVKSIDNDKLDIIIIIAPIYVKTINIKTIGKNYWKLRIQYGIKVLE